MQEVVPSLVDGTLSLSPAAVWTWMTGAAPPSREPGQPGPQNVSHIALSPPLTPGWSLLLGATS